MRVCSVPLTGGETEIYQSDAPTGTAEFYMEADTLRVSFITESEGELRQYGAQMNDFAPELCYEGCYRRTEFGGEYRVDTAYWKDGRIRSFLLTMPDGTEIEYIHAIMAGK